MRTTTGIFRFRANAERAAQNLQLTGLHKDRIALLVPGYGREQLQRVPVSGMEQPGAGKALGAVTGAAVGLAVGFELCTVVSASISAIGPVTAIGILGAAILGLTGLAAGAALCSVLDDRITEGLPVDELFIYQDALRKGRSVVLAFADDGVAAEFARRVLEAEKPESIDEAREHWWIGLRSAEQEHYSSRGRVTGRPIRSNLQAVSGSK